MSGHLPSRGRSPRRPLRAALAGTVVLAAAASGSALAATGSPAHTSEPSAAPEIGKAAGSSADARGSYDVRRATNAHARLAEQRAASKVADSRSAQRLTRAIGPDAKLDIDGTTGTVRQLANLDGYLTSGSAASADRVALDFVRTHHDALGLTASDVSSLRLSRDYVDVVGTHHLSWTQSVSGLPVFGNGLTAAVDPSGRLLMVGGSPVSSPSATASGDRKVTDPTAALRTARGLAGESVRAPGPDDSADAVALVAGGHTYRAWRTITTGGDNPAVSVVDAATGRLLYRRSTSSDASGEAPVTRAPLAAYRSLIAAQQQRQLSPRVTARKHKKTPGSGVVVTYFPNAPRGGHYRRIDFAGNGWLVPAAAKLTGNNAHAWSDVVDDNLAAPNEEVHPSKARTWDHRLKAFKLPDVSFCGHPYPCSWNPDEPRSWSANRAQNAIQVFFYVNNWHDHLMHSPIGFTEAAGNFQLRNRSGKGQAHDPVHTQTDDGANTDHGLPDGAHIDNANMDTPPDGTPPTMQMYLQHQPGTSYPDGDPFAPTNVGDEADTVYHEYTHGLSNRLVVDATGQSTLGGVQAGSMGEAWSDFYAMDYLVKQGLQKDKPGVADVVLFQYDGEGVFLDRTEPIDCAVGVDHERCTGGETGHTGGYTYADYAAVSGGPEVHSDGEIWAQTLWTLRHNVGSRTAEMLVTRAMELAADNPSFLDMRDAILLADQSAFAGKYHDRIWGVFAARGMGFYAGSLGGDDAAPAADFHAAPVSSATGTITGTVTDSDSGAPIAGAVVTLKFQGSGAANPTATTASDGTYTLGPVPAGHYDALVLAAPGYEPTTSPVDVTAAGATQDATIRRDWAASSGGAVVDSFTGPDFGPSCGPDKAIDLSLAVGWGSTTGDDNGTPTSVFVPKTLVVKLPAPVDITQFGVDPTASCGDGGSASTGDYRIETSPDATTWTTAAQGTFGTADRGQLNQLDSTDGTAAVSFVKFTILGNQTPDFATSCPDGAFSGCSYTDLTELAAYGVAP